MSKSASSPIFKRLWRLVRGIFFSDVKGYAIGLLSLMVLLALLMTLINVGLSFINSYFINALQTKNESQFFEYLIYLIAGFLAATPVAVIKKYSEQRLGLLWRKWLSRDLLKKYFNQESFYRIGWYEGIDNPDQRIEEDTRTLTSCVLTLFVISIDSILTLVLFVGILWSITWHLIIAAVVYTILGSMLTFLIGRKLPSLNFTQLKKEGDYRYKLVNVRDNAESIAFYKSTKKEYSRTRQRLRDALSNQLKIINLNLQLDPFINLYNYIKPILPIIIVAPAFLRGDIRDYGKIPLAAEAFVRVVEALSVLIQHFGTISSIAAVVTRLGSFSEALETASEESSCYFPRISTTYGKLIKFTNLSVHTPKTDQIIVSNLNLEHSEGGLLITGSSGRGKTSILRVISGIWVSGEGSIIRPAPEDCLFIPQKPYLILGSLRNQLLYTSKKSGFSDDELESVLNQVELKGLLKRLKGFDKVHDWSNLLSSGEQQQLSFARYLIRKPKFVFLDESTTAVDTSTEKVLYTLIKENSIAWMSVGYKGNISEFHSRVLNIKNQNSYEILKS
jgi:putative ATP-binding cassette transporter